MAIRGYSSGTQDTSSVPVVDVTTELNNGDMLYFDKENNIFRGGPGIVLPTKLSELQNDREFVTDYQLQAAISNAGLTDRTGEPIDLTSYAQKTYVDGLFAQAALGNHFSGDYNDLTNKPVMPAAFSGDYNDLTNKPNIPDAPDLSSYVTSSQLNGAILNIQQFSGDYTDLSNRPNIPSVDGLSSIAYVDSQIALINTAIQNNNGNVDLTAYSTTQQINTLINNAINAQTLFSGNYNDLLNKPAIPDVSQFLTETQIDDKLAAAVTGGTVDLSSYVTESELTTALSNYQPSIDLSGYVTSTQLASEISNIPPTDLSSYVTQTALNTQLLNLAFFSGDYNDLTNAPSIPSINGLSTVAYVDSQVAILNSSIANVASGGTIDLSTYSTTAQMNTAITGALSNITHPNIPTDISQLTDTTNLLSGSGNVDLSSYATQAYVNTQISSATMAAGGISNLDDLNDVAVGSLPQVDNADEFYLLEYNPVNSLWESRNFGDVFATQSYVSATVATALTNGTINLDGYATEQYLEQKLLERGHHFSGNYLDLANRPILFSGDYRDLINTPADNSDLRLVLNGTQLQLLNIDPEPDTVISIVELEDLGEELSSYINYADVKNLPDIFSGDYNDLVNRPTLFSGNYLDLANKPYIPSIAGLASKEYVDNRIAEPTIIGDKTFTNNIIFNKDVEFKETTKISSATGEHINQVMSLQTTDAVDTEALNAQGGRIVIEPNSTMMFEVHVIGATATAHFGVKIKGIVNNTLGITTMIGSPSFEILAQEGNAWDAGVRADDSNDNLKIIVQGEAGVTVDWTIFTEISKVKR